MTYNFISDNDFTCCKIKSRDKDFSKHWKCIKFCNNNL
jgi:hypothetical protein